MKGRVQPVKKKSTKTVQCFNNQYCDQKQRQPMGCTGETAAGGPHMSRGRQGKTGKNRALECYIQFYFSKCIVHNTQRHVMHCKRYSRGCESNKNYSCGRVKDKALYRKSGRVLTLFRGWRIKQKQVAMGRIGMTWNGRYLLDGYLDARSSLT